MPMRNFRLCDLLLLLCSSCSVVFSGLDASNLKKRIIDGNCYVVEKDSGTPL